MKYGIVIFPKKEVQDRVNALRKRYDPHYNLILPHITIKGAVDLINVKEAISHLEMVTRQIPTFTLKINKINTFLPTSPVVYFALEEELGIYNLHEQVNSDMLHHEAMHKFIPHITIAQDLSNQELHDIYDRLRMKDFDISFEVDKIHLLYQIENGTWTNYQTFLLRGNN